MTNTDLDPTIWSRLRAYCERHQVALHGDLDWYRCHFVHDLVSFPPATEDQLRATEERLGFSLPADLRRLYGEVANGGIYLGPVDVFYGALGGCPINPGWRTETIEQLGGEPGAGTQGWQLHPRIEEALLRHPRRYVVTDSSPTTFLCIGDGGCGASLEIDVRTGCVYHSGYWGELPDSPDDQSPGTFLMTIRVLAPSLSVWFERWLAGTWREQYECDGELLPEMVETADLLDPEVVWRGLYRFGPEWRRPVDQEELEAPDEVFDAEND